ncbi:MULTISPECIES: hypothetical protein [unclassified Isoptericola]|uniref:hypothetical protein n=1 Tax=unclassified Isoptericola TaxID=2623355 RepID=UPI0036606A2E
MRAAGTTAAGGYVGGALTLPTGRTPADLDALRERREAEAARRAATNPFAQPSGQPATKSTSRLHGAALVSTEYEKAAFTTPPPALIDRTEEVPVPTQKPARRGPRSGETRESREIRNRQIVTLYTSTEEVLTMQEVADRIGVSQATVSAVLKGAGVEVRGRWKGNPVPPSKVAEQVAARPDAKPAPRPRVRRVRRLDGELGRGFVWTCPRHKVIQVGVKVTFPMAVIDLAAHFRKDHPQEAAA